MRRMLRALGLLVLIMLGANPALALPAPMSDADLLSKSDLVARPCALGHLHRDHP
jgi:hypothetical protein